ncbi:MAG TPA: GntR family transcriptional regulator [Myxococcales bacterium]|jgi:DNA-binding GntR family transcriptional regulator|nr:GntR family transcriptional regulator [Myxococcales bacterium]
MVLEGLQPGPTLIDQAYEAILAAIREGRLPPGVRINQDELAASLRISRQPVGQALTILKSQGFVRDNGRRGLIVAPLEEHLLRSIYELREVLDPLAARLAAERCSPAEATSGKRFLAAGRKARNDGLDADMRLHLWVYEVAGNPILTQTMGIYWNHLRRGIGLLQHTIPKDVWDEHESIVDAIARNDPAAAEKHALLHTHGAAARL